MRSSLARLGLRDALAQGADHLLRVGESVLSKQASQETYRPFADQQLVVDQHIELSRAAGLELGLDAQSFLDFGGETRCLGLVTSANAVQDCHFHKTSIPSPRTGYSHGGSLLRVPT